MKLESYIEKIRPLDETAMKESWEYWDSLCKPLRSLGMLEELIVKLSGIYETPHPSLGKGAVLVMAADNGVVAEGVTQTGSEVTAQVVENMGDRKSAVCLMAKLEGLEIIPTNVGMLVDAKHPRVRNKVVRYGTANMAKESAMTREEAIQGILVGIETVEELYQEGYRSFLTGEMGIGNTTPSSAITALLLNQEVEVVTGRGAGLSNDGLQKKIDAIKSALEVNKPDKNDMIDVLAKVGSLDVAALVGAYIGAAYCRTPIFIDGFISSVAAYVASILAPGSKAFMFASHCSAEPAGQMLLEALGLKAPLHANMRLGEGTGAVAAYHLCRQAFQIYDFMPSFAEGKVETYKHL